MKRRQVALPLAVVASAMLTSAIASAEPRAVIELFTSQGCSSCPPADKLAGELSRDPSLVVMSLPIAYWKSRGDREVYTPQVVVNGVAHVLGSDKSAIDSAIAKTRKQQGTLSLPLTLSVAGDQILVAVPAGKD